MGIKHKVCINISYFIGFILVNRGAAVFNAVAVGYMSHIFTSFPEVSDRISIQSTLHFWSVQ